MYRLVLFNDGGIVFFDKNPKAVPTAIINQLILKTSIGSSRISSQSQIRLGKTGEFTARIHHDSESHVNVALLFPVQFRLEEPEEIVSDIARIYSTAGPDTEKFAALVNLRMKNVTSELATPVEVDTPPNVAAPEKPEVTKPAKKTGKSQKTAKKSDAAKKTKKKRTWDGEEESDSDTVLDYSSTNDQGEQVAYTPTADLDALDLGSKSKSGFIVKELTDELNTILESKPKEVSQKTAEPFGFLKTFVGGKKLNNEDLNKVLSAMEDHLVSKNVAKDVATDICDSVQKDLIGTSTGNWTSVKQTVRTSMQRALGRILSPATSTDLLASITKVHRKSTAKHDRRPYVISVVGVNGVGKSTNLGKLAFWFLQNDFKVLVAACDTFRSGAVEQLKVHVQRLNQLKGSNGEVELFDQGYGKDAAVIAKHAVDYATKHDFDVVLIDTAGRRHNDDRLMSSLEKFGNMAQPDKIIMVGEALVGTDSVEQAKNFDAAFGKSRHLDFFLISKCDTVGEMLGTLVNVTFATGVPVLFVGVGQQYTDLRTLSVDWAVDKLLS